MEVSRIQTEHFRLMRSKLDLAMVANGLKIDRQSSREIDLEMDLDVSVVIKKKA